MGREDLHKNMEDTFSDKEIFQAGDLSAYDCALFIKYIVLVLHVLLSLEDFDSFLSCCWSSMREDL